MSTTVTRPDESEVTAPEKSGRTSAGLRRVLPAAAILIAIGLIWVMTTTPVVSVA